MSKATRLSMPSALPNEAAPMPPPTAPHAGDCARAALLARDEPPMGPHQQQRALESAGPQVAVELRDVAAHLRPHIGVGGDRRGAFEFVPFARELGSGGHDPAGRATAGVAAGALS